MYLELPILKNFECSQKVLFQKKIHNFPMEGFMVWVPLPTGNLNSASYHPLYTLDFETTKAQISIRVLTFSGKYAQT